MSMERRGVLSPGMMKDNDNKCIGVKKLLKLFFKEKNYGVLL